VVEMLMIEDDCGIVAVHRKVAVFTADRTACVVIGGCEYNLLQDH